MHYLGIRLQRRAVAHALIDRNAHRESNASQNNLPGLVLVLIDGIGALGKELITELANIGDLCTGNALIKKIKKYQNEYDINISR